MSAHTDSLVSGAREPFAEGLQTCHPSLPREMEVAVPCRVADQGQEQLFPDSWLPAARYSTSFIKISRLGLAVMALGGFSAMSSNHRLHPSPRKLISSGFGVFVVVFCLLLPAQFKTRLASAVTIGASQYFIL